MTLSSLLLSFSCAKDTSARILRIYLIVTEYQIGLSGSDLQISLASKERKSATQAHEWRLGYRVGRLLVSERASELAPLLTWDRTAYGISQIE